MALSRKIVIQLKPRRGRNNMNYRIQKNPEEFRLVNKLFENQSHTEFLTYYHYYTPTQLTALAVS